MKCSLSVSSKIVLGVLVSVALSVQVCRAQDQDDDDGTCDAKMADTCFQDVSTNLKCHFKPEAGGDCTKKTVGDLCSAISEALDCSGEIVNTDCTLYDGTAKFEKWLQALRSVHGSLCSGKMEPMSILMNNSRCWSIAAFISCVEHSIEVNHIVDMLATDWSFIGTVMAVAKCNAKVTSLGTNCSSSGDVIDEVMHTFFSHYACDYISGSSGLMITPMLLVCATCIRCVFLRFNNFISLS